MPPTARHLLRFRDLAPSEILPLVRRAVELKAGGVRSEALCGRQVVLLFEKPSLRTKLSFVLGVQRLGGAATYFAPEEVGLGVREPVEDVARVVASMADAAVIRTFEQSKLDDYAAASAVPVINALTDAEHPCQALADVMTMYEVRGSFEGLKVGYVGDGNNVATSLAYAVAGAGGTIIVASPLGYMLPEQVRDDIDAYAADAGNDGRLIQTTGPVSAATDADFVYTDVWASMGQEDEIRERRRVFEGYQVNPYLMGFALPQARFMHDMPAHPGEEVSEDMLQHPSSVVYQQAENRMWAQMALMEALVS